LHSIYLPRQYLSLQHLRREVLRIRVDIPQQPFEVRGFGSGSKGGAAPIVQQNSGQAGLAGGELFDDQFSGAKGMRQRQEGIGRPVIVVESQLDRAGTGIES
jgi:hypothetical protein